MSLTARFMGPTWGPSGADRIQVGPMLAPRTLLFGVFLFRRSVETQFHIGKRHWPFEAQTKWLIFCTRDVQMHFVNQNYCISFTEIPSYASNARKSSLISRWLGTEHATSHYLNQCWPNSLKHNIYHQPSKSWNLQTVIYYFCVLLLWAKKVLSILNCKDLMRTRFSVHAKNVPIIRTVILHRVNRAV